MNCPSQADSIYTEGWNQNPDALNADATTGADLNHIANAKLQRDYRTNPVDALVARKELAEHYKVKGADSITKSKALDGQSNIVMGEDKDSGAVTNSPSGGPGGNTDKLIDNWHMTICELARGALAVLLKYARFIGPGFMVAVAYIDPGRDVFL